MRSAPDSTKEWLLISVGESMEILDRLRVPLNAQQRATRRGQYPYYGANGQVDTIDDYIFDGDLALVAEDGGYFNDAGRDVSYRATGRFWVNNHAHVLRPLAGISVPFMVHQFNSMDWTPLVGGTTRLKLTQGDLRRAQVVLPPLNEQRRIVAKIEALQARSRRAREALDAATALLDRLRQSVLAAAFRGDLTADWRAKNPDVEPASVLLDRIRAERRERWIEAEAEKARARAEARARKAGAPWTPADDATHLARGRAAAGVKHADSDSDNDADVGSLPTLPCGWCWTTLDAITVGDTDYRGKTPPKSDVGIPLISSAAVKHDRILRGKSGYISQHEYDRRLTRGTPATGDVVVTTEAPVGETALMPGDETYMLSRRVIAYRCGNEMEPRYVMHAMYGPQARRHLAASGRGTTVPRILKPALGRTPLPLPPLDEQRQIARAIDAVLTQVHRSRAEFRSLHLHLNALDQAILAKAFRGELVPQDPHDEPAAVLLERIRAERAAARKEKRR